MISATVSHANTSFFKSIILDQIIFHRVRHFARYFLPCLPLFFSIFDELWTMINFPPCLNFKTLPRLFIFPLLFVTLLFLPFSTLNVPTKMFFYRLTSSSMCHHSSMYSLYLTVAFSAMIEWRFWFPKKKKKNKITGDKFTNVVLYPNGCRYLI